LPDGRQALPRPYGPVLGRLPRLPTKEPAWTDPYSHTPNSRKNLRKSAGCQTPIPKCKDVLARISLCENLRNLREANSNQKCKGIRTCVSAHKPQSTILNHPSYALPSSSPVQSDCFLFLHFH